MWIGTWNNVWNHVRRVFTLANENKYGFKVDPWWTPTFTLKSSVPPHIHTHTHYYFLPRFHCVTHQLNTFTIPTFPHRKQLFFQTFSILLSLIIRSKSLTNYLTPFLPPPNNFHTSISNPSSSPEFSTLFFIYYT